MLEKQKTAPAQAGSGFFCVAEGLPGREAQLPVENVKLRLNAVPLLLPLSVTL